MNIYNASWTNAWLTIKSNSQRMLLGVFWAVFEPLFVSVVMTAIFALLLKQSALEYFSFVFIGKAMFLYFSKNISLATSAIGGNINIISNVKVNTMFFILSSVHRVTIQMILTTIILMIFTSIIYDAHIIKLLNFSYIMAIFYVFIIAISSILAIFGSVFPDLSAIVSLLTMPLMFISGVFFNVDVFPLDSYWVNFLPNNPIYILITDAREILLNYDSFVISFAHLNIFCTSLLLIITATYFSNRYRAHIINLAMKR